MAERFAAYITPLLFYAGGGIALPLGPWGFWAAFRNKYIVCIALTLLRISR